MKKNLLKEFKLKKTANTCNTAMCGYFKCSYEKLVEIFGKPHYIDDNGPDVFTEWSFCQKGKKHGISLYDHKESGNGRKKKNYYWHIGAYNGNAAIQFIKWLEVKTGINHRD